MFEEFVHYIYTSTSNHKLYSVMLKRNIIKKSLISIQYTLYIHN